MSFVVSIKPVNNNTMIAHAEEKSHKCELYLLIIVIKLTILISTKIIKTLIKVYGMHNKRIINQHNKMSIEKLQNKLQNNNRSDPEAGQ